ncbi:MAG: M23 family metallopeptidase [Lachnospiraceae bacterium]|nr:M23 family metallopeptidase [Lachnospiraceae bacterium]
MDGKKRKRFTNHVLIITSDAVDANVKQFRIKTWVLALVGALLCALFGALLGYLFYEERIWQHAIEKSNNQLHAMEQLHDENLQVKSELEKRELELTDEIQGLKDEVQSLSAALNQKVESEEKLREELEKISMPTSFPLNGSASSLTISGDSTPIAKIVTSDGTMVVATAKGTVIAVNDDLEYGHNVWVDHGNGYMTVYRNQEEPVVKQGDVVFRGTTLFVIGKKNTLLGYQIMLNGAYINPTDVMDIKG